MKLRNRTTIPDAILTAVLVKAGRAVGARTSGVIVVVTQGRRFACHGSAPQCTAVRFPNRRKRGKKQTMGRWIKTDGGYIAVVLPDAEPQSSAGWGDPRRMAETFYRLVMHEWAHIREYQDYFCGAVLPWSRKNAAGRRPKWKTRPEEQRAIAACEDAEALGHGAKAVTTEILDLALAMEVRARKQRGDG